MPNRLNKKLFLFFIFHCFFNVISSANVENYIKKAEELAMANNDKWLSLLHYKKHPIRKYKSIIDDKKFFFSRVGKYNPEKELIETIRMFLTDEEKGDEHSICKFPARFHLLKELLNVTENDLRVIPSCEKFNEFYNTINAEGLTIIFPTTYMNNPASMFGHTLLKFDDKNSYASNTHLNSVVLNFGANTGGETSGLIYAFRGVFGLYQGFFSAIYYYKMVNKYNNIENRAIWEYRMNYRKEEISYFVKHVWELNQYTSRYYFFRENCSFFILESLNVMRPELNLSDGFLLYTAPIETIRVLQKHNLITDINYRPSMREQIGSLYFDLSREEKKNVKKIIRDKNIDKYLAKANNREIETSIKLLQYNKTQGKIEENDYRRKLLKLLKNYKQEQTGEIKKQNIPKHSPDEGHLLSKIYIGGGYSSDRNYFTEIILKPSYHEIVDNTIGFENNAEINFFSPAFRLYKNNRFVFQKFDVIKIKSLAPWNEIFKSTSFSVLFSIDRVFDDNLLLFLETNGGITYKNNLFSLYSLVGPKVFYGGGQMNSNFIFGINFLNGVYFDYKYARLLGEIKYNFFNGNEYNFYELSSEIDINPTKNKNLSLNLKFARVVYNSDIYKNHSTITLRVKKFF